MILGTLLPSALILSFVFGWNNGPLVVGNLAGSGSVSYKRGLALTAAGLVAGTFLGWREMQTSLIGSMSGLSAQPAITLVFAVSFVLMAILTVAKIPVSMSVALVGSNIGASIALHYSLHVMFTSLVVVSWLLAPLFGAVISIVTERGLRRLNGSLNMISSDILNRWLIQGTVFYVTFTLGLNNVGLIFGTYTLLAGFRLFALLGMVAASVAGMGLLGKALASTVGEKMVGLSSTGTLASFISSSVILLAATYAHLPLSITMALVGSMVGVGMSSKLWVVNTKLIYYTVASWFLVALAAALVTYFLV